MSRDRPRRPLPTTLVLDFYDSYTRNVLSLVSQLFDSQIRSTASPGDLDNEDVWEHEGWQDRVVVVNVDSLSWDSFVHGILPHIDCVILGPGPGTPHRESDFSWPHRLLKELGDRLPIFGLCLGCQGLATVFGGKVVKAAEPKHGQISLIRLSSLSSTATSPSTTPSTPLTPSLFAGVPSPFSAVQYNSLVVDPHSVPDELEVLAWTEGADGKDEVMALQHRERPLWGVQFHPESIESTYGARILSNFLSLALDFHASSPSPSSSSLPFKPNLPAHVLTLSASLRPTLSPPLDCSTRPRWEQRSKLVPSPSKGWTPQQVFEKLAKGKSPLGDIWLDSARPGAERQYSHIVVPQATWSYCVATDTLTIRTCNFTSPTSPVQARNIPLNSISYPDLFSLLAAAHGHLQHQTQLSTASSPSPVGFVGYIGYEMKDVSLPQSRRKRSASEDKREKAGERSDCELAFAPLVFTYDHAEQAWTVSGLVWSAGSEIEGQEAGEAAALVGSYGLSGEEWENWTTVCDTLSSPPSPSSSPLSPVTPLPPLLPRQPRPSYLSSIRDGQSLIRSGDTYELCLTTTFSSILPPSSPHITDPYPLYLSLRASNPAPYSAYFRLPHSGTAEEIAGGGLAVLSSSPERFLRISADGQACMKPIKGTVRRCPSDPVEDERRKMALEADAKERAENLMIVDLIRNDLLAVCEVESVKVEGLMKVETYETVHQLVTTVVGSLSPGVSPVDAVKASFPPGSMTGAPKLRSVQLLDELEKKEKRGVYSGIFGCLSISGASDWSVVIRTLVKRGQDISLGAGGAITHLSDPEKEWEEVLTKVDAVLGGLGGSKQNGGQ